MKNIFLGMMLIALLSSSAAYADGGKNMEKKKAKIECKKDNCCDPQKCNPGTCDSSCCDMKSCGSKDEAKTCSKNTQCASAPASTGNQ
jgi:hypothetical protein